MLRAIALSLALLFAVGTIIPLATDYTEAGPKHHRKHKKKKLKKYSKAWWRWYHKMKKRKKAMAARKRALRARQMMLAKKRMVNDLSKKSADKSAKPFDKKGDVAEKTVQKDEGKQAVLPSGEKAPKGWKKSKVTNSEQGFSVDDDGGNRVGSASLTLVGMASGDDGGSRAKSVGGVQSGSLRRMVIDRMMKEDGWVVNDYFKEVDGKKVYVVVAQSSKGAQVLQRYFYFTEIDGKIYNLATAAPSDNSDRLARESEKVLNSLQRKTRPVQAYLK